jgi:UDP-2,3-diacylglucosamine pyrophosphatase LpxH
MLTTWVCALCSNELVTFGKVKVVMETTHKTADGRTFLVMHGDRYAGCLLACMGDSTTSQHLKQSGMLCVSAGAIPQCTCRMRSRASWGTCCTTSL